MKGSTNSFNQAFLKKWLLGLKLSGVLSSKTMNIFERKRAIKLSADIAMASTREGAKWSHALIANLSKHDESKSLVKGMLGEDYERPTKPCYTMLCITSNKILRRSLRTCSRRKKKSKPTSKSVVTRILARALVKKRTQVLKSLVPGGNSLDDLSLLDETLDYVTSLRTQVQVMQLLTKVLQASTPKVRGRQEEGELMFLN